MDQGAMRHRGRGYLVGRGWLVMLGCALALGALVAGPASRAAAQEWTVQTGAHLDLWNGVGQDGRQILVPLSLGFDAPSWGLSARGAYGDSERDPGGGGASGSIRGFTDTTLSGYLRFTAAKIEFQAGLDLDLPTGVSRLKNKELVALQDPDLVTLERFGEGFDINPTITAYRNFGKFGLGLGVGYLVTGKFDPTRDVTSDDLDPGDELTGVLIADFYVADAVRLLARAAYRRVTADERAGVEVFREGDELDLRLITEIRPEPWYAVITLRDTVRFKAERPDASGRLTTESRNSNGNDIRGAITIGYIVTDDWLVEVSVEARHVLENDYPEGNALHDGGRTKVAFGPSITWTPTRKFAIDAGVRYFILDVKQSPTFPKEGTIHGVHADIRLTYRF